MTTDRKRLLWSLGLAAAAALVVVAVGVLRRPRVEPDVGFKTMVSDAWRDYRDRRTD